MYWMVMAMREGTAFMEVMSAMWRARARHMACVCSMTRGDWTMVVALLLMVGWPTLLKATAVARMSSLSMMQRLGAHTTCMTAGGRGAEEGWAEGERARKGRQSDEKDEEGKMGGIDSFLEARASLPVPLCASTALSPSAHCSPLPCPQ